MQRKYAADGLVAMSVSLDDPHMEGTKEAVLKFLRGKKAAFTNVILDESSDFWTSKFDATGPPFTYVFDRQGRWRRFKGAGHYEEIENLVPKLLKER